MLSSLLVTAATFRERGHILVSSSATAILGSSGLSRCALPHLMTIWSLLNPSVSTLFPVLLTDSNSSLLKKKKKEKSGPKVNIWKFSTVVKPVSGVFRLFLIKET